LLAQGEFDGVLGFSQGAVLAYLVAALRLTVGKRMRFAVLVSGFPTRADAYADLITGPPLCMPSLHVWGGADVLVPPEASDKLSTFFDRRDRVIYTHDGGHLMPFSAAAQRSFVDFLGRQDAKLRADGYLMPATFDPA
jgi:predicted esterase